MKKRTIERIPYLGLPRVVKKETAEYVSVTAVEEIGRQPCLFVEVYRNKRECRKIPVVRIAMTKKDFGTYFTASGTWSRGRIPRTTGDDHGLIWR
ncbi:MAG: hypothetical protein K2O97_15030, partial [Acetatifactor sp.]|nr:hypothetical protein [Acetatifactor sp.]